MKSFSGTIDKSEPVKNPALLRSGVLALYLFAFVFLPALHCHTGEGAQGEQPSACCRDCCKTDGEIPTDHDDCSICRILHQSVPIVSLFFAGEIQERFESKAIVYGAEIPISSEVETLHSRAPPA